MARAMDGFGWNRLFEELGRVIDSCESQIGVANENYVNYIIDRLETGLRNVTVISETLSIACEPENELQTEEEEIISRYRGMTDDLSTCIRSLLYQSTQFRYQAQVSHVQGVRGCPSFAIEKNQIEYLRAWHYSWTEIADLIGVSRMTIYRRRR